MKLYYHKYINSPEKHDKLIAMLTSCGLWLLDHLGDAHDCKEWEDLKLEADKRIEANAFLRDGIVEAFGPDVGLINLATWTAGPGYTALCVARTRKDDVYRFSYHDMVIEFEDDNDAIQFKLAVE